MGPGFESQRDHKKSPLLKKRTFLFYPSKACFNEEIKQKSTSLVKQGGLYAWIELMTRVHVKLPEGSQKKSTSKEADFFVLSE